MSMRIPQQLIAQSHHKFALAWNPSTSKDVVGYDVFTSQTVDGTYTKMNKGRIPQSPKPQFFLNGVSGNLYFQIRAYDKAGNYSDSNPTLVQV